MKIDVNIDLSSTPQIEKRLKLDSDGSVVRKFRDEVERLSRNYIPHDRGVLQAVVTYENNHSFTYKSPYAHYMYVGKKAVGASRPKGVKRQISNIDLKYQGGRTSKWVEKMWNVRKHDIEKDIENFIKRGGK